MASTLKDCTLLSDVRQNPCSKSEILKNLYKHRAETGDIIFLVESKAIHAHRCVLAALSPRYKAQFYGAISDKEMIRVSDASHDAFAEFLQFFYTDTVTLTIENIEDVLNLAQQSLVDILVAECINFLRDAVGLDKLLWFYRLASQYEIVPLEKQCLIHIEENLLAVFKTDDFLSCEHDMLCHILEKSASWNYHSIDLFDGCISWARTQCEQNGTKSHAANLRTVLGEALCQIQFSSMTVQEFSTISENFVGILTEHEKVDIFAAIARIESEKQAKAVRRLRYLDSMKNAKCKFVKGQLLRRDSATKKDGIGFLCNKTINLNGFVMHSRIAENVRVDVYVRGQPIKCNRNIDMEKRTTKVTFTTPIRIKPNAECRIFIQTIKARNIGWYGYNVLSTTTKKGVTFRFQRDNQDGIYSITHLLFDVVLDTSE